MEAKQSGVQSIPSALLQDAGSRTAFPLPGSLWRSRAVLLRECQFSAGDLSAGLTYGDLSLTGRIRVAKQGERRSTSLPCWMSVGHRSRGAFVWNTHGGGQLGWGWSAGRKIWRVDYSFLRGEWLPRSPTGVMGVYHCSFQGKEKNLICSADAKMLLNTGILGQ